MLAIIALISGYTIGFLLKNGDSKTGSIKSNLLKVHYFGVGSIVLLAIVKVLFGFEYAGANTEKVLILMIIFTGIILYRIPNSQDLYLGKLRWYFGIYFWFFPLSIIIGIIPIFRFMIVVFGSYFLIDGETKRYQIDAKYCLEESWKGMLSPKYPQLILIEKKYLIFEKVLNRNIERPNCEITGIKYEFLGIDEFLVEFEFIEEAINLCEPKFIELRL